MIKLTRKSSAFVFDILELGAWTLQWSTWVLKRVQLKAEPDHRICKPRTESILIFFYIFCWPCISLQILGNNQLDALFYIFIYFMSLNVSSVTALIIRRSNCINTSSGMMGLCKWLLGMPVRRELQCKCVTFCVGSYVGQQCNIPPHTERYVESNIPPHTERYAESNIPPHTERYAETNIPPHTERYALKPKVMLPHHHICPFTFLNFKFSDCNKEPRTPWRLSK